MRDESVTLPDGRTLAYTELGAFGGALVVHFHGAPGSRHDLVEFDDALAGLGVRVVSPDRPGYGGSSIHPGRQLDQWPADVAALGDHLGAERFAVLGYSSGGPYAVACAALMDGRVTAAGVVAGVTDMSWPRAREGYLDVEVELMSIGDTAATVASCEARFGPGGAGLLELDAELAPADHALFADESTAGLVAGRPGAALAQGVVGYAHDITVQGRPWAFDPGEVSIPVRVVHGSADTIVPVGHGRHTAEVVRGAELLISPGQGHLSIVTEIPRLMADLTVDL